ncbi:MAG: hypothetical protein RL701_288 [Pseudomonadota bacterium]
MTQQLPQLIAGRYRTLRALGHGGMATVFSVHDEVSGQRMALKRLAKGAPAYHVTLFEREYHTLATLQHPCIVQAYDYASDADGPFYTMELLAGSDVSKLVPLPYPEVCRILRDVASGVALLHARRLLHRDLSARNVWRMPDGSIKLIDFGTMATFGKPPDIAGTPPFMAPECVHGGPLDQRTDLYALGALGYYLLTGRHAYPARTLAELDKVWREQRRPLAKRVAELSRRDLLPVPPALEALIDAMLSRDPMARPTHAADVIDRLTVIGSLAQGDRGRVAESYLNSPAFVGRKTERRALRQAQLKAAAARATTVVIEASEGLGRTRLLTEFALDARLGGALVLQIEPLADRATHAVAEQYALALLAGLPHDALAAAKPYAATLAHLSPELRLRLNVDKLADIPQAHGEARMRIQSALLAWFLDVAKQHVLILIADDFDAFDEASAAWLAAVARAPRDHKLLVAAAVRSDQGLYPPATTALLHGAQRLSLAPLSYAEMAILLRSVFGEVPHLARLVDVVQQRTEGNPGHAMDLAEHLCREGEVVFAEGAWMLPQSISPEALPANRVAAELARLDRLPPHARQLGQALSIREGHLPLDMCASLAEIEGSHLFEALEALVRESVLAGSAEGYRFARESLRLQLQHELTGERRKLAHRRLGQLLLRARYLSPLERLRGGVHLLLGGDEDVGSRVVADAGKHYGLVDLADLGPAAPSLERALEHFRATGRSRYEMLSVLSALALAGYYADRKLATRYGPEAVDTLETLLGLKRARRWQGFVGRKPGIVLSLALAALTFAVRRRDARVPSFREAMVLLFNCVAALTGVCTICVDQEGARTYAAVIEPLTALGPRHVASFMHRFCMNLVATLSNRLADTRDRWQLMLEELDTPATARQLPGNLHALYLAGALYARGVLECWRDDSRALEFADRLQSLQLKLYDMSADQVRMMYYANRGDSERFHEYRLRVEMHAIQRGTAWQAETWTYSGLVTVYLRTGDVAGLKECVKQCRRLCAETTSLRAMYTRTLSAYLVARGTPTEALDVLERNEPPHQTVGWTRNEGLRARALNTLGQHGAAKTVCLDALAPLSREDRNFCALNLSAEIELANAEAGLGHWERAEQQLQMLLATHGPAGNVLSIGALHEALAELAALRGDEQALSFHVAEVARYFRSSRDPALVARHERLERLVLTVSAPLDTTTPTLATSDTPTPRIMTVVHRLRHGGDQTFLGSAEWALKQLCELAHVTAGLVLVKQAGALSCAAQVGSNELEAVVKLVTERWALLEQESAGTTVATAKLTDHSRFELHERVYRITLLRASLQPDRDAQLAPVDAQVLGALVLSGDTSVPSAVLSAVTERLVSTQGIQAQSHRPLL